MKKARSRVKSRMDQRTRTQLPLLPSLLRAVQQHHRDAEERVNTARDRPAGTGSPWRVRSFSVAVRPGRRTARQRSQTLEAARQQQLTRFATTHDPKILELPAAWINELRNQDPAA